MIKIESLKFKHKGSIAIVWTWFVMLTIIIFLGVMEMYFINAKAEMVQNDIVLSNLATYKNIDKKRLGDEPQVFCLSDPEAALKTFKEYLAKNMNLDNNLVARENSVAKGNVIVKDYIIYNVEGTKAEVYTLNSNTNTFSKATITDINSKPIYTPNKTRVTKTSIHATLRFNIEPIMKGILGATKEVEVTADTDITY